MKNMPIGKQQRQQITAGGNWGNFQKSGNTFRHTWSMSMGTTGMKEQGHPKRSNNV